MPEARCARCEVPLARSSAVIGAWLARDVPVTGIWQGGTRPGLCPDGEPHVAGDGFTVSKEAGE